MTSPQRGDSFTHPDGRQRFFALVPCAGSGSRSGAAGPKQYESLAGRALVLWTLEALARVRELDGTLVVLSPGDTQFAALAAEGDAEAASACWRANVGGGDARRDRLRRPARPARARRAAHRLGAGARRGALPGAPRGRSAA